MVNTGELIDSLAKKQAEYKKANDKAESLKAEVDQIKAQLIEALDAEGTDKASSKKAGTVSIQESIVFNMEDWEKFWAFVHKNKAYHLVQKRVSEPAMREMLELKKAIPGAMPFTKRSIRFTAAK